MNRLQKTLQQKNILSIYFTADYPFSKSSIPILQSLQQSGVSMVELGLPFSDPLADGEAIQQAHTLALQNGFSVAKLFEELQGMRDKIHIPVIAMGYFNPILQYGVENFVKQLHRLGIDGLILPDMPLNIYEKEYKKLFQQYNISFIPIITPTTNLERAKRIYEVADSFVYLLSSSSTTLSLGWWWVL